MDTVSETSEPGSGEAAGAASQAASTTTTAEIPPAAPYGAPPGFSPPPGQGPPPGYGYGYGWGGWAPGPWGPAPEASRTGGGFGAVLRSATTAWIVAGVLALAVIGLSVALASSNTATVRVATPFGGSGRNFGGLSPRSGGPSTGTLTPGFGGGAGLGVFGTVASVGSGSFTVTDFSGQTVTVDEQSSTVYFNGATSASSSAVVTGARVAVQGSRSGNTVTATRVVVLPSGLGSPSS